MLQQLPISTWMSTYSYLSRAARTKLCLSIYRERWGENTNITSIESEIDKDMLRELRQQQFDCTE